MDEEVIEQVITKPEGWSAPSDVARCHFCGKELKILAGHYYCWDILCKGFSNRYAVTQNGKLLGSEHETLKGAEAIQKYSKKESVAYDVCPFCKKPLSMKFCDQCKDPWW